ncbi:DUF2993 domain-containing protein [Cellulomonas sp. S1-8]|uniref:LmeA family phospholipid-binding protein n=1 Tax=Cellulomonas sp. S1-8 TaxID=2904790 RepID=UPI0022437D52|nr:DUF2993 domain-containing protein [Cellulomonas sp. S1-8]UZN03506.1 DUF2993 domain-containing protein [Cellulomonas sp. S1-8]
MGAKGLVTGVVALGLVAVGAYVADGYARGNAEDQAAAVVTQQLQVDGTPDVQIAGFPFLTQLLARSLDDVTATAPGVVLDGIAATDVTVDAHDVSLDAPYRVGSVLIEATVATASVQEIVSERTSLELAVDGDVLRAAGDLFGMPLTAGLVPRVEAGRLLVDVQDVTLGAATLRLEQLPGDVAEQLVGIEVPLEGLPAGVVLERAVVVPDGVRFTAAGADVVLEQAP